MHSSVALISARSLSLLRRFNIWDVIIIIIIINEFHRDAGKRQQYTTDSCTSNNDLDWPWPCFNLHSHACIAPHSDASLLCRRPPSLPLTSWVTVFVDLFWLYLSCESLIELVLLWIPAPLSIVLSVTQPSQYRLVSLGMCSLCFIVQFSLVTVSFTETYRAQRYCEQMINISYFYDLLESMGNCCQLSTCGFRFCAHAGMHHFTA